MKGAVILNYIAQFYSAFSLLFVVPVYIKLMGSEAYGLVAFFIMLQAWLQVLEAGMSGSITRVVAISKDNEASFKAAQLICMKIIGIFFIISLSIIILGNNLRGWISEDWFKTSIDSSIISICLLSMFFSLSFKYFSGPFRSILVGLERHVEISIVTIIVLTLKYPLSIFFISRFSSNIEDFFMYQVAVCIIELFLFFVIALIFSKVNKVVINQNEQKLPSEELSFSSFFKFSFQLSILSIAWVVVTQVDKLILSKYMQLENYGFYSLAVSLSGAILVFAAPLNQILMPRLTSLFNQNNESDFYKVYFLAFSFLCILSISLGLFLYFFGWEVVYLWTGEVEFASFANTYLGFLALGNSISVLMSMVFILLFCVGNLKIHTLVYVIYSLILIPTSIIVAKNYGGHGASIFWMLHNVFLFLFWGGRVLYKFFPIKTFFMIIELIITTIIVSSLNFSFWKSLISFPDNSFYLLVTLASIGIGNVAILFYYFSIIRKKLSSTISLVNKFDLIDTGLLFK